MIYLDNAATTKPDGDCLRQAEKYLYCEYYNPSAPYAEGYNLRKEINGARQAVLDTIAPNGNFSLIFTSCGTEADNQALFSCGRRGNVVTTEGEHSAVYAAANELKQRGVEVRFAPLNGDGSVNGEKLLSLVDDKTSLVSVIHVNNETGAVNDVADLAKKVKQKNKYALFHSDGVQAFGKTEFRLTEDIDLYSVSAHKIGGVKGCGALFKRKNLAIKPFIFGGGQENGLRSGTENVFAIMAFSYAAAKRYANLKRSIEHAAELKKSFLSSLDCSIFRILSPENGSPFIVSISAEGLRGETVLHECDDAGLIIGTGSACSSNEKKRFSRVILACGHSPDIADGVLRVSFSPENTTSEVVNAAEILNSVAKRRKTVMA